MSENVILEMRGITKIYPNGFVANKDVNLAVREGEILGYLARGYNSTYIARRCSSRPTRCAPTSTTSTASWG